MAAPIVRDVMMPSPLSVEATTSLTEAARVMRDNDVGDVLVVGDGALRGILTDRDIVVRAVAEDRSPESTPSGEVCSPDLATVAADDTIEGAADVMRKRAVRRLPVVDQGAVVGVVSIGDLAVQADPDSALADISAARPNL
jgi:CBS domain-containing protein